MAVIGINIPGQSVCHTQDSGPLCVCTLQGKLPAVLRAFRTLDAPIGRFLEQKRIHSPGNADPAWLDTPSMCTAPQVAAGKMSHAQGRKETGLWSAAVL